MAIPVEVMASKKIIYIDRDEYHPDDNPLSIDGNPFYFKDIESLDKYFNEIGRDELRLVHYSYYNGCDEPSIYELEEI